MTKALLNNAPTLAIYADDLRAEELPESLHEVVNLIGLPAMIKMVERFPGIRIFVPRKIKDDHAIVKVIGLELAQKLAKHFDGSEFAVPKAQEALILARNRQIRRLYGPSTAAQLALMYDLTERQIYRIVAEVEQVSTQESLF